MKEQTYYLSSLESTIFSKPRECVFLNELEFESGKKAIAAKLSPPIIGQNFGFGGNDIEYVVLTHRHEGEPVYPIKNFPCFVFVCCLESGERTDELKSVRSDDLKILAWGELYRTEEDARNHKFDTA